MPRSRKTSRSGADERSALGGAQPGCFPLGGAARDRRDPKRGPWTFGKKVLLPAGTIERIDRTDERVFVGLTKEQIKNAPEFDEATYRDEVYRSSLGDYYAPLPHQVTGVRRRSRHLDGSSATVRAELRARGSSRSPASCAWEAGFRKAGRS